MVQPTDQADTDPQPSSIGRPALSSIGFLFEVELDRAPQAALIDIGRGNDCRLARSSKEGDAILLVRIAMPTLVAQAASFPVGD